MCRWMGSHFHDWIDYNGVAFSIELLEWGRTFSDFWGKKILLHRESKWSRLRKSESCCLLNVTESPCITRGHSYELFCFCAGSAESIKTIERK